MQRLQHPRLLRALRRLVAKTEVAQNAPLMRTKCSQTSHSQLLKTQPNYSCSLTESQGLEP